MAANEQEKRMLRLNYFPRELVFWLHFTPGNHGHVKKEIFTTYPFFDPDPLPVFARSSLGGAGQRIYPYFVFTGLSLNSRSQEWTVVRLKNKYLEVSLLPEVGGKIWGARDLQTGRDFLHTNRVLKFREIALRGPWTSGGIEFNFGVIGHGPHTATPVDYYMKKRPDGSVSCTVGNYDWASRTRWQVTVTVIPTGPILKPSPAGLTALPTGSPIIHGCGPPFRRPTT